MPHTSGPMAWLMWVPFNDKFTLAAVLNALGEAIVGSPTLTLHGEAIHGRRMNQLCCGSACLPVGVEPKLPSAPCRGCVQGCGTGRKGCSGSKFEPPTHAQQSQKFRHNLS